ncbi:protein O-mannosyl-transferase 1-like [Stegodyphus dumicola]|uniref:protein O-mannosyl-transferase 1-like n=1 Tax=Stegodyphus dumicola TaxID=202533 RepID=UPI0015A81B3C|nr:protein O-mannosyl-transferase 1-like [Stegodyphus dumicola]
MMVNKVRQRKKGDESVKDDDRFSEQTVNETHSNEILGDVSRNATGRNVENLISQISDLPDVSNSDFKDNNRRLLNKKKQTYCTQSNNHSSDTPDQLQNVIFNKDIKPVTFSIEIDIAAVIMLIVAIWTRMQHLGEPRGIVFDELHYGKFASMYMKQTFFFDSHPPLGKQLVALAGYITGFDGNAQFERIGGEYSANIPLRALRAVPAFFGSILIPTVYYLMIELGFTHKTAILAGVLMFFENAYLTQSRFILMESILIWFSAFGILAYLKFRKIR